MKAQPLTIPATRAWLGTCNCPQTQCRVKDARKCQNWTLRNNNFRNEQKQA